MIEKIKCSSINRLAGYFSIAVATTVILGCSSSELPESFACNSQGSGIPSGRNDATFSMDFGQSPSTLLQRRSQSLQIGTSERTSDGGWKFFGQTISIRGGPPQNLRKSDGLTFSILGKEGNVFKVRLMGEEGLDSKLNCIELI